jgi:diacylglycerol kinase (ATP)
VRGLQAARKLAVRSAMSTYKSQPFPLRLKYALVGVGHALRHELSFRIQCGTLAAALAALLLLRPGALWWALVGLSGSAVLAAELLNTAIEQLADALHPEDSPAIRVVKDCAAGAVLVAALGALAVAVALALHLLAR